LLIVELLLLAIAVSCAVVIYLSPTTFDVMILVSFCTYLVILIFLLYAGISSVHMLRSIYTDEFTVCVKKVWLILAVFFICFLVKTIFGFVAFYKVKVGKEILSPLKIQLIFTILPLVWELLPIATVYYLHSGTVS
jgi:hypothetical protein